MSKLVIQYRKNPTLKNAMRLRLYCERHPMALCVASEFELCTLQGANLQVAAGDDWRLFPAE
jgi:hypothetical protein